MRQSALHALDLPSEVWTQIFLNLPVKYLPSVAASCSFFNDVVSEEEFWRLAFIAAGFTRPTEAPPDSWQKAYKEQYGIGSLGKLFDGLYIATWADVSNDPFRFEKLGPEKFTVHSPSFYSWNTHLIRFPDSVNLTAQFKGGGSNWEFVYYYERVTPERDPDIAALKPFIAARQLFAVVVFRIEPRPDIFVGIMLPDDNLHTMKSCAAEFYRKYRFVHQRQADWFAAPPHRVTRGKPPAEAHHCSVRCMNGEQVADEDE